LNFEAAEKPHTHIFKGRDASHASLRLNTNMNRPLMFSLLATLAVWLVIKNSVFSQRIVPAEEAAARLKKAWADHHTQA
jgi:hypothetical protein